MQSAISIQSFEHAREWMISLLGRPHLSSVFMKTRDESKLKPSWKQFDDTHRWDSTAEEWIPIDPK